MSYQIRGDIPEDEDVTRIMREHKVDESVAEQAQELIDAGVDEEEAIDIAEEL